MPRSPRPIGRRGGRSTLSWDDSLCARRVCAWTRSSTGPATSRRRAWASGPGASLPPYGIKFADHTAFNRKPLGLDTFDQIYGVELSHTTDRHLFQVAAGPGRADSIKDGDGTRGVVASARLQFDLSTRAVLVASGLF